MAWLVILSVAAAWGLLSVFWLCSGWLLEKDPGTMTVRLCPGNAAPEGIILRYQWLKALGVLRGRLLIVENSLSARQRPILQQRYPGIEFCSLEELPSRLEVERENFDGNGTGDPAGRHQRRGISEL